MDDREESQKQLSDEINTLWGELEIKMQTCQVDKHNVLIFIRKKEKPRTLTQQQWTSIQQVIVQNNS